MSLVKATKTVLSKQSSKRYINSGVFTQNNETFGPAGLFKKSNDTDDLVEIIQGFIDDGLINTGAAAVSSVVTTLTGTDLTVTVNGIVSNTEDLSSLGGGTAATAISPASDDLTGAVGVSTAYAREDHKHPSDATKLSVGVPSANIIVGDATNVGTPVSMTGDVTITNAGVTTVVAASITQAGKVELATSAETQTGTDATRAVTPFSGAATYPLKASLTTKGDIYAASAASNPIRLAAGTDGYALTADSAEATGLKYDKIKWSEALTVAAATTASGTNLEVIPVNAAGNGDLTLNGSDYNAGDLVRVRNLDSNTNSIAGDESFTKNGVTSTPYVQPANATTTFQKIVGGGWFVVSEISELEGLDINGQTALATASIQTNDELAIYDTSATANRKVTADAFLGKPVVHMDDTTVAPATAGEPTIGEATTFITADGTTDVLFYYTGDDTATPANATYVYWVDISGNVVEVKSPSTGELQQYTSNGATIWATGPGVTYAQNVTTGTNDFSVPAGVHLKRFSFPFSNTAGDDTAQDLFFKVIHADARAYNVSYETALIPTGYIMSTDDTLPISGVVNMVHLSVGSGDRVLKLLELGTGTGSDIGFKVISANTIGLNNVMTMDFGNF